SLTDALNITLGGRLSQDEKDFSLTTTGTEIGFGQLTPDPETGIIGPFSASDDESWSDFTPKVSLEYTSSDELFLYATYAKGFKSGGYNGLATDSGAATTPFDQEEVDSYEVGLKADFFENLMRLNVAAYYMDYVDLQVFLAAPGGIGFVVENAGEATIQGLELELFVSPLDGLDFSATYSYIDSNIDEFEGRPELVGNNLSRTPENSASLSAQYIAPLGDQLSLLMRADYSYQDKIFLDIGNSSISAADSYELVNVRLALQSEGVWEVALWGRNITDEEYRVHALDSTFGGNASAATIIGDPSMWGVTASYFF
ncbi:MAG: TonB-dependent receptor, partial [Halioglobus sp.]